MTIGGPKYLGFDLSTQQLKAIVINDDNQICHNISVDFDRRLPEFGTSGGILRGTTHDDCDKVTAPVHMWLRALEICLIELREDGLDFNTVVCVSGCAQQHGSVWWKDGATKKLASMDPKKSIGDNLTNCFTLNNCPTWMDSSTSQECEAIETYINKTYELSIDSLTGSRAFERFTGPQIAKIIAKQRDVYDETERITLISNFLATTLAGSYMPVDVCDAAGTNMMDVRLKRWSRPVLESIVSCNSMTMPSSNDINELLYKLGSSKQRDSIVDNIVNPGVTIGHVSEYFQTRFGFSADCHLVSFTGDTLSSMIGLNVAQDELIVSLGTSDTACFWLREPKYFSNGHNSVCPLDPDSYVGMVGFKNGSRTRERIRNQYCVTTLNTAGDSSKSLNIADDSTWKRFNSMLVDTQPGNHGNIGFYFDMREIYPPCEGDFRFNDKDEPVSEFAEAAIEVRACVEGQFMRLYNHIGEDILGSISSIKVTGGASSNGSILQVLADVFDKPVCAIDMPNSACLGAAFLARYAHKNSHECTPPKYYWNNLRLQNKSKFNSETNLMVEPCKSAHLVFIQQRLRYRQFESMLTQFADERLKETSY